MSRETEASGLRLAELISAFATDLAAVAKERAALSTTPPSQWRRGRSGR